ncbi:MAG TPA: amino acid adenylation domain-containing protein, partial [Herpetosiphonaceae bacterium]
RSDGVRAGGEGQVETSWRRHVAEWQQVFDDALAVDDSDPTFQIAGWNSSFTNEPIPADEMREWVDQTVERIQALRPRRVLEIGVGTGLLLFRIAPSCERYVGTDIAPLVLDDLRQRLSSADGDWSQVQLEQRAADDLSGITGPFDTVIVNSVVQYFPGIDYLLRVLEQATSVVAPGGSIVIGDVRSLTLLEAFHTAVQDHQGSPELTAGQLRQRVQWHLAREQELVIDPDFFAALRRHLPQIGQVAVLLKRGRRHNELARFRYDVVLHIGERPAPPELDWQDWQTQQLDVASVRRMLEAGPDLLSLRGIPNARILDDLKLVALLAQADDAEPVESLRRALPTLPPSPGVDPEALWALGDTLPYAIDVLWSPESADAFDVVFRRRGGPWADTITGARSSSEQPRPWQAYATNPLAGKLQRSLIPELRQRLEQTLPEYMLPSAFVLLPALPRTPNGKLDREALPAPDRLRLDQASAFVAPRTPIEHQLATIWAEILDLERVGIGDNFFTLGGHSLLATQVMSRVRDSLQIELPLRALFEAPTISGQAALIEARRQTSQVAEVTPIAPVSRDQPLDLSFAQERLWVLDQLMPGNLFYNMPTAVLLTGPLDHDLLQLSLDEVVRRHESIRTTIRTVAGRPLQIIAPTLDVPIRLVDLRALPEPEREAELRRLAVEDVRQPFDLQTGPLLRVTLFRIAEQRHVLFLAMHHIISDGWSLGVLVQEIATLYAAFAGGQPSPLPPLPIQYADYAIWQRQWLEEGVAEAQLSYWKAQLADMPQVLELPTDRPRPPVRTANGARRSRVLPASLTTALHSFSRREGVTPFMTLLTAFNIVLHCYSGQERIVVGSPIANRNRRDIEGLIGFFINALALPTDLTGDPTLRRLLARVRESTLGAYAHQDLPFERLVAELQPARDLSRTPLFQVMFVLQNTPMPALQLPDVTLSLYEIDGGSADYDLKLELVEAEGELFASFQYNTDLFEAATIDRLHQHFELVLERLIADSEQRLSDLSLLTDAERGMLDDWNATTRVYSTTSSVHGLFEEQAARTPDAIAVVFEDRRLSYRELNTRANQLARYLQRLGVQPESHVAICLDRSIEMVVGLLGILKAGAAYLPFDPNYPAERRAWMLADAQPQAVLTQQSLAADLPTAGEIVCLDADWQRIAALDGENLTISTGDDSAIYAIYTSGSTGRPKGVINTHGGVRNRLLWMQETYGLSADDRVLQKTPFTFDVSVWEFFWPLISGAQLVVARPEGHKDNGYLVDLIERAGITTLHFVPSMLSLFLAEPGLDRCRSLRRVICSGEALPASVQARFFERLPEVELHNLYGPTEAAVDVTAWACRRDDERRSVPIGRPVANTQLQILDRHLNRVPPGVPGELHIGGVQLARGYLNRPDLTAERFIPDPFSQIAGARLYRTGDLARFLPDGTIDYLGRIDHQVKLRGFRIELDEIAAVLRQHEAIREALVLLREDRPGDARLVAYVTEEQRTTEQRTKEQNEGQNQEPRTKNQEPGAKQRTENREQHTAASPSPAAIEAEARRGSGKGESRRLGGEGLRSFLAQRLPDYMVPSAFVVLDALPLTSNGKIDRRALPDPDDGRPELHKGFVAPRTPTEEVIATLWAEVLGLKQVGVFDNFFELGGHSLRAILLLSRVREVFRVSLPVQSMFEATTVAALAELLITHEEQPGKIDKIARLLQRIKQVSPEELAKNLEQRRKDGQRA